MNILPVMLTVALGFTVAGAQTPPARTALEGLIETARADLNLPALALGYTDANTAAQSR